MRIPKEGCWRERGGRVLRHAPDNVLDQYLFEYWHPDNKHWVATDRALPVVETNVPDPSVPKVAFLEYGPAIRKWMRETRRVFKGEDGDLYRWNVDLQRFEIRHPYNGWWKSHQLDEDTLTSLLGTPADGDDWNWFGES